MFAVLYLPDFPLQAGARHEPELAGQPLVIVEESEKALLISLSAAARAAHLELGMSAVQAMARCSAVQIRQRSALQEAAVSAILLATADAWSPWIEETAAGICTLELRAGLLHQAAGAAARSGHHLQQLGLRAQIGLAANPHLALLAARQAAPILHVEEPETFLRDLPLSLLEPPAAFQPILAGWGVATIGQLAALSLSDFTERLGPGSVELWQRARGTSTRLLNLVSPPAKFSEVWEYEHPLELLEPLLFSARRLIDQLTRRLQFAYLATQRLFFTLRFEDGRDYIHPLDLPEPTADPDVLFRMLQTHLESFRAESPIVALTFLAEPIKPVPRQLELFESGLRNPHRFYDTLAQLSALLGADRVGTPVPEDSHRADAFQLRAFQFAPPAATPAEPACGLALRRFRPPQPAQIEETSQRPAHLSAAAARGEIVAAAGPWLSSGHWWDRRSWRRVEWDVQLRDQTLCRLAQCDGAWFLDGLYD